MSGDDEPMPNADPQAPPKPSATLLWDRQNCVPLDRCLSKDDMVLLLTPAVVPPESQSVSTSDPFEPLGQSLSKRHSAVRHVPYTKSAGITGVHVAFIKKADVVIFVVTGLPTSDEPSQPGLAEAVGEACDSRPLIVTVCCEAEDYKMQQFDFQTLIQATGFSAPDLQQVSSLLLDGEGSPGRSRTEYPASPKPDFSWFVQPCDYDRDLSELYRLWMDAVPRQFHLERTAFESLLRRDGYTMHHVVRDPTRGELVGACATYTTFANSKEEQLIGSIAVLIVRRDFRGHGIGQKLHDDALSRLGKIRGVHRVQLGTTFPRLLYGIPVDDPSTEWFKGRGWILDESGPGMGRVMADWLLRLPDFPRLDLASAGLSFRPCEISDALRVADMVGRESERKNSFGWYDQYARILDSSHMEDVVLGFEGATLVAAAITYTPNGGNPTASDIPWAASIGSDIGGVTCICIKDDDPEMVNRRDTVLVRLLNACCKSLASCGMAGVFVDGLKSGEKGLETLGFRQWAQYRESWRHTSGALGVGTCPT